MSDQSYESGLYRPLRMLPERPVDGQRCGSGDGQKGRSRDTWASTSPYFRGSSRDLLDPHLQNNVIN